MPKLSRRRNAVMALLAVLVIVVAAIAAGTGTASASTLLRPEVRVRAINSRTPRTAPVNA